MCMRAWRVCAYMQILQVQLAADVAVLLPHP